MKGGVWACTPRLARLASPARHDAFIVESPRSSSERPRRPQVFDWRAEAALPRRERTGLRACEHLHHPPSRGLGGHSGVGRDCLTRLPLRGQRRTRTGFPCIRSLAHHTPAFSWHSKRLSKALLTR